MQRLSTIPIFRWKTALSLLGGVGFVLAVGVAFVLYEFPSDTLQAEIAERVAALHVKPSAVDFTYQKALQVRADIQAQNFDAASQITRNIEGISKIRGWRYYPFDDFITDVFHSSDVEFAPLLDEWVAKRPNDAKSFLLRAEYNYDTGWARQGHDFLNKNGLQRGILFLSYMAKALSDIDTSIHLDDRNPYGFYLKLLILQASGGASQAFSKATEDAIQRHPTYYRYYEIGLSTLQPRWGGSVPAMYDFVDKYAGNAPKFSPLKLLYLTLYQRLLATASVKCSASNRDNASGCVASLMQKFVMPGLGSKPN